MNTVTFKYLYDRIIRRMAQDPLTDIGQANARMIVDCLNERISHIWPLTPFPGTMRTQERGFRPTWRGGVQYHGPSPGVAADEVLFGQILGAEAVFDYYVAKTANPPINQPPNVAVSDWKIMTTVTPYLDFELTFPGPQIGMVFGIYNADPSVNGCNGCCNDGLRFQPSEHGVRVTDSHEKSVWVWFQIQAPQYTIVPYIDKKTYDPPTRVYLADDGRVYRCVTHQSSAPFNPALWREEIVPEFLQGYLLAGTCADYLKRGNPADPAAQVKLASAAVCESEAVEKYQGLVDLLDIQGYKPKVQWPSMGCQQWLGDVVEPIRFQGPSGSEPESPIAPIQQGVVWEYHPEVQYLKTIDGVPSLSGLPTTIKQVASIAEVVIAETHMVFQLVIGPADPLDSGEVAPDDYASVANDKHWVKTN